MKKIILVFILFTSQFSFAQHGFDLYSNYIKEEKKRSEITTVSKDSVFWTKNNVFTFDVSEVAFVNWNAGGTSSISGLLGVELVRNYKKNTTIWANRLTARYGVNKQQDYGFRKTDDVIELISTFGYRKDTLSNWYSSANISFKTQFSNGYTYENDSIKTTVSQFMAPAYLFLGVGTIYGKNVERFSVYLSPLTLKSTYVLDQNLADLGSFGVKGAVYDADGNIISKGKNVRRELGILIKSRFTKEIAKNIFVRNYVSFYTDYINNFGNIDVDWEITFDFKVNNFVRATFGSHLKYDDDIKFFIKEDGVTKKVSGAKIQWKQILGIGVLFDL